MSPRWGFWDCTPSEAEGWIPSEDEGWIPSEDEGLLL
jgi:hypothetical protein